MVKHVNLVVVVFSFYLNANEHASTFCLPNAVAKYTLRKRLSIT